VKVVAKTFIALIGSRVGSPTCTTVLLVPNPLPLPLPPVPTTAQQRLNLLATSVDLIINENPITDLKDKGYRMYTEHTFDVTHRGSNLISVVPRPIDTDSGTEGPLQAPSLTVLTDTNYRTGSTAFAFNWLAKGRPPPAAEPGFQLVCPRNSIFIWHVVEGSIDVSQGSVNVRASVKGSHFPSHRLFVQGAIQSNVRQGEFRNLWVSLPSNATMVD
jgi:hypothetical protein